MEVVLLSIFPPGTATYSGSIYMFKKTRDYLQALFQHIFFLTVFQELELIFNLSGFICSPVLIFIRFN